MKKKCSLDMTVQRINLSGGTYIENPFSSRSIKDCILYINKTYFLYKGRRSVRPMARKNIAIL